MERKKDGSPAGEGQGSDVEPSPAPKMRHEVAEGSPILVEESSGIAAAEATGKTWTDNEEDPEETAGSG